MEPCTTYQNTHHQSTVVIGSQRGKTCWPFMFKLMSNINQIWSHYYHPTGEKDYNKGNLLGNLMMVQKT